MVFLGGYKLNISSGNIHVLFYDLLGPVIRSFFYGLLRFSLGGSFSYIPNADPFLLVPMLPILSPSW